MTENLTLESMIKKMKETRYCLDCQTEVWDDDYPYHNADHTFTTMTVIEGWGWKKVAEAEEAQRKEMMDAIESARWSIHEVNEHLNSEVHENEAMNMEDDSCSAIHDLEVIESRLAELFRNSKAESKKA